MPIPILFVPALVVVSIGFAVLRNKTKSTDTKK